MGEVMPFPEMPKSEGAGEEKEGKILEFKRKVAEQTPEGKVELREKVDIQISGEDLYAILIGLTKERLALKEQMKEIDADPDLKAVMGPMVEGLLMKNSELMKRLSSQDPKLEEHFKNAAE